MAAVVYIGNMLHDLEGTHGPFIRKGLFGTGTAIEQGDLLELTATVNGNANTGFVPMDADYDMGDGTSFMAFAYEDVAAGDRTGYYKIIVPRPYDVFRLPLAAAGATVEGTDLYWSSSNVLTVSAGSNIMGVAVGQDHFPLFQGHVTKDAGPDVGTTIKSQNTVLFTVQLSNSSFSLLQTA